MGERSSPLPHWLQGINKARTPGMAESTGVQENWSSCANSKELAVAVSSQRICSAMPGGGRGGSCPSGEPSTLRYYSKIPTHPPPQGSLDPALAPRSDALGINHTTSAQGPAIDSIMLEQPAQAQGIASYRPKLPPRRRAKISALSRFPDSQDPHEESSKRLAIDPTVPHPTVPAHATAGAHIWRRDQHALHSVMPRTEDSGGSPAPHSHSEAFEGFRCSHCQSTNIGHFSHCTVEAGILRIHNKCLNCHKLCPKMERSVKVADQAGTGASQHRGWGQNLIRLSGISKSLEIPASISIAAPSSTEKPSECLPDNQHRTGQSPTPPRPSSWSDTLGDNMPSGGSNVQQLQGSFPQENPKAMGPCFLNTTFEMELPSKESGLGNEKELSFKSKGLSLKRLRDSIRGCRGSPLQANATKNGDDPIRRGSGHPCPRCESTVTRLGFNRHFCYDCRQFWTPGHLQLQEGQLPPKVSRLGKEKETGPHNLTSQQSNDGNSNEALLNAFSCSHCKSMLMPMSACGIFCQACWSLIPPTIGGQPDNVQMQVPADQPVVLKKPIMVDASTQTDQVVILPMHPRYEKVYVYGLPRTNSSAPSS